MVRRFVRWLHDQRRSRRAHAVTIYRGVSVESRQYFHLGEHQIPGGKFQLTVNQTRCNELATALLGLSQPVELRLVEMYSAMAGGYLYDEERQTHLVVINPETMLYGYPAGSMSDLLSGLIAHECRHGWQTEQGGYDNWLHRTVYRILNTRTPLFRLFPDLGHGMYRWIPAEKDADQYAEHYASQWQGCITIRPLR